MSSQPPRFRCSVTVTAETVRVGLFLECVPDALDYAKTVGKDSSGTGTSQKSKQTSKFVFVSSGRREQRSLRARREATAVT
jgi:hypothetical protein